MGGGSLDASDSEVAIQQMRIIACGLMLVFGGLAGSGAADAQAPFAGWHELEGVDTSNDDYTVWVHWKAINGSMKMPGFEQAVSVDDPGKGPLPPFFAVELQCRADGRSAGYVGPVEWTAALLAPYPPQAENVYNVWHPMYWILGLVGRAEARTPLQVWFEGREHVRSTLVRERIHYSNIRPWQMVKLDPGEVWTVMRPGREAALHGQGPGTEIDLQFEARPDLGPLLDLMQRHCSKAAE